MKENTWEIGNKQFIILTSIILIFGFVLLIINLTHESFWLDECYTARITNNSFSEIIGLLKSDFLPPFYYFLVKTIRLIGGESIFTIRLCSVFGLMALALLGCGPIRRVFGNKTGLLYAFLIIITPVFFSMAKEARMYTWAPFFINGMVLYGYLSITGDKNSDWIKFGLFSLGAIYTHYYSLFVVITINIFILIWILFKDRKKFIIYFIINYLVFLCYLPWIPILVLQISKSGYLIPQLTLNTMWLAFLIPFGDKFSFTLGVLGLKPLIFFITLIIILFGLAKMILKRQKGYILNLLVFGIYISIFAFVLTAFLFNFNIFQPRYIIIVIGLFVLNLAIGLSCIENKIVFSGLCILLLALLLPNIYLIYKERFNGPMDEVVSYVNPKLTDDTVFIHFDIINAGTFCYYFPKSTHFLYDGQVKGNSLLLFTNKEPYYTGSDIDSFLKNKKNIWIVTNPADKNDDELSDSLVNSRKMTPVSTKNYKLPYSWYSVSIAQFTQNLSSIDNKIPIKNAVIKPKSVMGGEWSYYDDKYNNGTSKIIINNNEPLMFEMESEIIDGQKKDVAILAGTVTADYAYGFIGMLIKPDLKTMDRLKKAKGIKFKSIGDGKKYRCIMCTSNVKDYNYFAKEFVSEKKAMEHVMLFNDLKQEDWGNKTEFLKNMIFQIEFQTVGQPQKEVLLKIFDLEIIE